MKKVLVGLLVLTFADFAYGSPVITSASMHNSGAMLRSESLKFMPTRVIHAEKRDVEKVVIPNTDAASLNTSTRAAQEIE